ncbi:hypothetical protein N7456_007170 [Penicillium angulare]|uniref:Thioesterase domain-containing protein n=1 Tax=Penicillium angulare TaxID=116970 RepID=A0A9W9FJ78_9EURO|nr:hypothetical protein N7456_007170 [Penicillium angulare]
MNSRQLLHLRLRAPTTRLSSPSKCFIRNTSTATPPPPTGKSSPWIRRLIYAGIFGSLGVVAGSRVDRLVAAPPLQGSQEDKKALEEIQRVYELGIPIVQELRKNPDYVEADVYQDFSEESKRHRLTSGPLAGSRGIALQRVFSNDAEKKMVSVVYFGSALEGWPTMVHGGALGTVIDENMGRAALRHFPARTGLTANLNINYRAPVYSGNFYTFHTQLDPERSTDVKGYVSCQIRDQAGQLCVEASGLFVVPKKFQLARMGDKF